MTVVPKKKNACPPEQTILVHSLKGEAWRVFLDPETIQELRDQRFIDGQVVGGVEAVKNETAGSWLSTGGLKSRLTGDVSGNIIVRKCGSKEYIYMVKNRVKVSFASWFLGRTTPREYYGRLHRNKNRFDWRLENVRCGQDHAGRKKVFEQLGIVSCVREDEHDTRFESFIEKFKYIWLKSVSEAYSAGVDEGKQSATKGLSDYIQTLRNGDGNRSS